jgi:hypothetical protein
MNIVNIKSFCGCYTGLKNEGWKGGRVEGEKFEGFDTRCADNFSLLT